MFKWIFGKPVHELEAPDYEARNDVPLDASKYDSHFDYGLSDHSQRLARENEERSRRDEQDRRDREEYERRERERWQQSQ